MDDCGDPRYFSIWQLNFERTNIMAKGKNSKKETKKPKKEKPKILATANSITSKPLIGNNK